MNSDVSGSSKDQIFGSLDSNTSDSVNKDFHLNELAHSLKSIGPDLSRVQVHIDLCFFTRHFYYKPQFDFARFQVAFRNFLIGYPETSP
jgi:hypothetical protein